MSEMDKTKETIDETESKHTASEEDDIEENDVPWRVYAAHTLSTWGDNMWWFAGGVFMLHLQDEDLRLTAIYGLVIAASVIIFGASLGKWIDRTRRLTGKQRKRSTLCLESFIIFVQLPKHFWLCKTLVYLYVPCFCLDSLDTSQRLMKNIIRLPSSLSVHLP